MKKLLLVATLCCGVVLSTQAQDKKVTFGLRAGVNFNTQVENWDDIPDDYEQPGYNVGFHVGGVVDINLAKYFYFQPGLLFTTQGFKVKDDDGYEKLSLYYLDVPLIFSFAYPLSDNFKLRADVGPAVGLGLFGKHTVGSNNGSESSSDGIFTKASEDGYEYGPEYNRFNLGLKFGIGVEVKQFTLGAHYNLGLNNVLHIEGENSHHRSAKNRSITISLGYNF
jgi:hypothetical protein